MALAPGQPYALEAASPTTQSGNISTAVQAPPAARVVDIEGFPVEGTSVAWAVTAGGGSFAPASPILTNARGVSALTSWTLGAGAGLDNHSVEASVAGLVGSPVVFTSSAVAPGPTTMDADSATTQLVTVSTNAAHPPRVLVRNAGGAPVEGVPVAFAVTAGGGQVRPAVAYTAADGTASAEQWTMGAVAGTNTVTATVSGLAGSPVAFTATGVAAGATTMAAASTVGQEAQASTAVPAPPSVKLTDALGNAAGGMVQFAVATGGGSMVPADGMVFANGSGVATLTSWTIGAGLGVDTHSVTATVAGLTGSPVTFLASGVAGPPPDPPTNVIATSSTSQSGPVGVAVATPPTVQVRNAALAAVAGIPVLWVVTAGAGSVGAASTLTDGGGLATVPWILGAVPGTHTLEARVPGLSGSPVVFTATATLGTGAQFTAAYAGAVYVPGAHKLYCAGGAATAAGSPNVVRCFDAATRRHLNDITVGVQPRGMVVAPAVGGRPEKVYVGMSAGTVLALNPVTDTLTATITIAGDWARGVYVTATDRVVFVQASGGTAIAINPADDTQATLIAAPLSVGWIAHSPVTGNLYIPRTGGVLGIYAASDGAAVTTVSGFPSATSGLAYAPGTTDSIWWAGGSTRLLTPMTTATNTRRTDVSTGADGTTSGLLYGAETGHLYAVHLPSQAQTIAEEMLEINPATDTVLRRDPVVANVAAETASVTALSAWVPTYRAFWVLQAAVNRLHLWHAPSRASAVRSLITASQASAPHVTVAQGQPFAAGDLVSLRRNATGSYRTRLDWPAKITSVSNGLRREMPLMEPTLRGERNYATNPWGRDWISARVAPGWAFGSGGTEYHWHGRDANTWTSDAATLDGVHTSTLTFNLRDLTAGDVIEPGDNLADRAIATRAVVDGTGRATVTVIAGSSVYTGADGDPLTLTRPTPPAWLVADGGVVVPNTTARAVISPPYYPGLPTLWVTVEYWLWAGGASGALTHNARVAASLQVGGIAAISVAPTDTTVYVQSDGLVGPFSISLQHTLTGPGPVDLVFSVTGDAIPTNVAYIRRVQATLGPEADIDPSFEFNASRGALFHAGQRALRDRGAPLVSFRVALIEDPDRPARPGVTADLRHPAAGLVATPRVLSVQRTIVPGAREADLPVVELDNRPPSLSRQLSRSGVA